MKKIISLYILFCFFFYNKGYTQSVQNKGANSGTSTNKSFQVQWKINPFNQQVFIENKSQFNGIIPGAERIYYVAHLGAIDAFFTNDGIIYRMVKYPKTDKQGDPDADGLPKPTISYVYAKWDGSNNNIKIEGNEKQSYYYTYPSLPNNTIKTNVFKKITYLNIYNGIDLQYSFIEGKPGIEYKLIVHPGADISLARLAYNKNAKKSSLNAGGDIKVQTSLGIFTMSKPVGLYEDHTDSLKISYLLKGNEESFKVFNPDASKTYIIDPWITDPAFTLSDKAYDVDYDNNGNVYAYGGDASGFLQFVKMNKLGVIQWSFNASAISSFYYGGFCTDKVTGTSYLVQGYPGGQALKVNTLGVLVGTFLGNPQINELWRAKFDACNGNIVIAGGGTNGTYQAGVLDSDMSSVNPVNVLGAPSGFHDMSMLAIDPDGNQCYMTSAYSVYGDHTFGDNMVMQLPLPSLSPTAYLVHERLGFQEVSSIFYVAGGEVNGFNGATASPNWLYLYNGDTLGRYHKNTGVITTQHSIRTNSPYQYGGLDVDPCDNIFVGVADSIYVLDSTYAVQTKIPLHDTVFDVELGQNNVLYACGVSFVTQLSNPVTPNLISSASGTPSSCSACNGSATVNINCGVSPYGFKWSDGNTNQTDTGLCPGVYTVTVTDASCPPRMQTAIVPVTGENGFSVTISDTNPDCALKKGNATAHVTGGVPPYLYKWSNGSTNPTATGLVAGTYVCIVTDNSGCKYEVGVVLINPTAPDVKIVPAKDSMCTGDTVKLTVSGAKIYTWAPNKGLSCYNCPNPVATPSITTTYTVTGIDSNGCTATTSNIIKVYTTPKISVTGRDSVCSGYTDTLIAKGGNTYVWSNGATTSSINYKVTNTTTLTVTAQNGMCSKDTSIVIRVVSPAAKIKASSDSVCQGDSILLSASGGLKYKWNTGNTTTNIWVKPQKTTTYTLYAFGPTCKDSALQSIKITPEITAAIAAVNDTVCPHGATTITATGIGGKVTRYHWNTGASNASITVNDTVTTTYTATVYGLCDSVQKVMQVVVIPLPKPVISGSDWRCKGKRDTLIVSSSINPTKYVWDNGKTSTTYITGAINSDSIVSVTGYNSLGCPVTVIDTVYLRIPPVAKANPPAIFCARQPITLTASAQGTFAPFTYSWSTGQTGTSITIDPGPDTITTYTVTASNGCIGTATTTAIPNVPLLLACCNQVLTNLADTTILVASGNSKTYQWQESPDKGTITCLNPPLCDSVRVIAPVSTSYTVIGTDSNGCQGEQVLQVDIDIPCFDVRIPNVFTPNNAGSLGLNNVFYIQTINMDAWSIQIYDRWGKEMFSSTNPSQYWDGTTEGGAKASDGVYYYIITATCQNNTYKRDGFVQLIR